jgi:hypothetical protein
MSSPQRDDVATSNFILTYELEDLQDTKASIRQVVESFAWDKAA